jgi:hypothetical protein
LTGRDGHVTIGAMLALLVASIFLNGVRIDDVRGQSFEKCKSVRIDDKGDMRLDCPGYQVEGAQEGGAAGASLAAASAVPATPLARHYFLVTEQGGGAPAPLDVDVFVNGRFVRKLHGADEQIVFELTRFLSPGANKLVLTPHKSPGRTPPPAGSYLRIVVGEGSAAGSRVLIENPLADVRRTAAEQDGVSEELTIQAR